MLKSFLIKLIGNQLMPNNKNSGYPPVFLLILFILLSLSLVALFGLAFILFWHILQINDFNFMESIMLSLFVLVGYSLIIFLVLSYYIKSRTKVTYPAEDLNALKKITYAFFDGLTKNRLR